MNASTVFAAMTFVVVAVAHALTDPAEPEQAANTFGWSNATSAPRLTSVSIAPGRRLAIIEGQAFVEGQTRAALTVTRIAPDHVEVSIAGRGNTTLPLQVAGVVRRARAR